MPAHYLVARGSDEEEAARSSSRADSNSARAPIELIADEGVRRGHGVPAISLE